MRQSAAGKDVKRIYSVESRRQTTTGEDTAN